MYSDLYLEAAQEIERLRKDLKAAKDAIADPFIIAFASSAARAERDRLRLALTFCVEVATDNELSGIR